MHFLFFICLISLTLNSTVPPKRKFHTFEDSPLSMISIRLMIVSKAVRRTALSSSSVSFISSGSSSTLVSSTLKDKRSSCTNRSLTSVCCHPLLDRTYPSALAMLSSWRHMQSRTSLSASWQRDWANGSSSCFTLTQGDVLLHQVWHTHLNITRKCGTSPAHISESNLLATFPKMRQVARRAWRDWDIWGLERSELSTWRQKQVF